MQYILTQDELDALKSKSYFKAAEFLAKLGDFLTFEKVCIDLGVGSVFVVEQKTFKNAVTKTIEFYAKSNP